MAKIQSFFHNMTGVSMMYVNKYTTTTAAFTGGWENRPHGAC